MRIDEIAVFTIALISFLVWPLYRLLTHNRPSSTLSVLKMIFLVEVTLVVPLTMFMILGVLGNVTDAGDTIMIIMPITLLSFAASVITLLTGILIRKVS
jgi:hypothetical protein